MSNKPFKDLSAKFGGVNILAIETGTSEIYNRKICAIIERKAKEFPTWFNRSEFPMAPENDNFTCWGKTNLFEWNFQEIQKLKNLMSTGIKTFAEVYHNQYRGKHPCYATSWINFIRKFDGNVPPHRHHTDPFNIAGVYYASGDFSTTGGIRFWFDVKGKLVTKKIRPTRSMLLLFSSTLLHAILPYEGQTPRITFGFDVRFRKSDFNSYPCSRLD